MEMKFDKLSNLCDIQIGKTPSRKVAKYWGKGYPWVAISDLKKRYICKTKEQITSEAVIEAGCKLIPKDTLLMSFKLSIGKLAFTTCDLYTNEAIVALSVKNKEEIDNNYLYYALQNIPLLGGAKVAVKGNTLNKKSLGKLKIPLQKNIDDQIKIANLLSQVEALIAKREESINLLDELLRSTFLDMFMLDISEKKLEHFGQYIKYMTSGARGWAKYYSDEGDLFLRINNVKNAKLMLDDIIKVKPPIGAEGSRTKVKENDLLFSITADLGRTAVIPNNFGTAYINQHLALLRLDLKILNPTYVAHFYLSSYGQHLLKKFNKGGVKAGLNFSDIKKMKLLVPPKPLQDKFSTIVQQVEESKKRYQDSLNELHQLFGSLSQRAFKGELDLSGVK